jgi:hypothetical protein
MAQRHSCKYYEFADMGLLSQKYALEYANARYDPGIVKKVNSAVNSSLECRRPCVASQQRTLQL